MNIKDADIVRMTGEAGGFDATPVFLKRFAELVAAHAREELLDIVYGYANHLRNDEAFQAAIKLR